MSFGLAITACATLIPIKANAVTLTLEPVGSLGRNPGESIAFDLVLNPNPTDLRGLELLIIDNPWFDRDELSFDLLFERVPVPTTLTTTTTIARVIYKVLPGVKKDGNADVVATVRYRNLGRTFDHISSSSSSLDVQPVPEPLTIFGAATALGYGAILKRKYSKKTES
jgi:hypothetical protein